ncbi:hypothetical protein GAP32_150 [Cronobacter phage vB_CsaM_GAP32]|uniref:Uncharacterized protein n=1 Tax=Cronobacter phage vB_CsaM_GAP32 TaxID=1141136 RepID=K4F9J0_9CAUD|nr:hypothetical protein GAP32_150 [Cronobacter phage vB_CsaM_GAP32]AFC21600.1 hypothetical protein GAP32_150 [Cronobacter phage vB_CsaM_GAP32]
MKKSDMLFALLRKSKVLKDIVKTTNDRKFLIELKYQYCKLSPSLRNMIRVMATDIDRFNFTGDENSVAQVMNNYYPITGNERTETGNGHPELIDTITGNRFKIFRNTIKSKDVIVFKEAEHEAFIVACGCLIRAKQREDEIIKKNAEEQKRLNILSEFL